MLDHFITNVILKQSILYYLLEFDFLAASRDEEARNVESKPTKI